MRPTIMASTHTCPATDGGEQRLEDGEFVVVCAFCSRVRSHDGLWISPLPGRSHILAQEAGRISHTYCPECLARHYPTHRTGAPRVPPEMPA
jgi:hypothetical protein